MFIVLIRRSCPGPHENILTSKKALSCKNKWPLFFTDDLVTSDYQRLAAVGCRCRRGTFAFQLSKKCLTDYYTKVRLSSWCWNEAFFVAEPEILFFCFSRGLWNPG